jgi:CBS domain containing-hemolysin-like protein
MTIHWPFIAGAVFVVASISAAATTLRVMTRFWMRHWVEAQLAPGAGGGSRAAAYLAQSHHLLAVATAATAFVVALTGVLMGVQAESLDVNLLVRAAVVAAAFLIVGQALPRALARHWAPALAPTILPILRLAALLLAPVMYLSHAASRRGQREGAAPLDERHEIEGLLREGDLEGIGETKELEFISEVVEFGEKQVSEVMTPRTAVTTVDRALPPEQMARQVAESGFSRVPVFSGSPDEIVGIVHVFDVLATAGEVWPTLRPVAHVPAGKRCSELLFEMLAKQQHLAVVLDEHGGTVGIVTLEDLLEELVGDIRDEHDAAPAVVAAGAGAAVVDGSTPVFEVAARFDAPLVPEPHERAESIGGLLARRLGRIPVVGERVRLAGLEITIVEAEPARVVRLLVQRATTGSAIDLGAPK